MQLILFIIIEIPLKTRLPFLVKETVIERNLTDAFEIMFPKKTTLINSERYIVTALVQRSAALVFAAALVINIFRLVFLSRGTIVFSSIQPFLFIFHD